MQQVKDMQNKLAGHDRQIKTLEDSDKVKDVIIAEVNTKLQHISKQIDELAKRLEKYIDESNRNLRGKE
jgi:septal ring factor EnvC (AmiA/AmiB activator)